MSPLQCECYTRNMDTEDHHPGGALARTNNLALPAGVEHLEFRRNAEGHGASDGGRNVVLLMVRHVAPVRITIWCPSPGSLSPVAVRRWPRAPLPRMFDVSTCLRLIPTGMAWRQQEADVQIFRDVRGDGIVQPHFGTGRRDAHARVHSRNRSRTRRMHNPMTPAVASSFND